jgi:hypothetical protein
MAEAQRVTKIVVVTISMGLGPNYIPNRVQRGEPVDVVIVPDEALNELIHSPLQKCCPDLL